MDENAGQRRVMSPAEGGDVHLTVRVEPVEAVQACCRRTGHGSVVPCGQQRCSNLAAPGDGRRGHADDSLAHALPLARRDPTANRARVHPEFAELVRGRQTVLTGEELDNVVHGRMNDIELRRSESKRVLDRHSGALRAADGTVRAPGG